MAKSGRNQYPWESHRHESNSQQVFAEKEIRAKNETREEWMKEDGKESENKEEKVNQ